uniref:RelA/SpoT domain-containing protein n=1 Tax=viral metagenome TaxID=1070528 RepID=A0A6C0D4B9_9ZZZZ
MLILLFLVCNFLNLSNYLLTTNKNNIIRVISKELHNNNNIIINYESRIKSRERIIKKIQKYKVPYDIYGLRIIYNDTNNIYNSQFAYTIKTILISNFNTLDYLYDDYIASPKINNYQSLHIYILTNILIEIQVRNSFMHNVATNGSASNYYY